MYMYVTRGVASDGPTTPVPTTRTTTTTTTTTTTAAPSRPLAFVEDNPYVAIGTIGGLALLCLSESERE